MFMARPRNFKLSAQVYRVIGGTSGFELRSSGSGPEFVQPSIPYPRYLTFAKCFVSCCSDHHHISLRGHDLHAIAGEQTTSKFRGLPQQPLPTPAPAPAVQVKVG